MKSYGRRRALDGFDLTVEPGEIVGPIGHNGAGKTTFVEIVSCRQTAPVSRHRASRWADQVMGGSAREGRDIRQQGSPEELLPSWTLVDGDYFCLMLKFSSWRAASPSRWRRSHGSRWSYVAGLVKVPAADFAKYSLTGRTAAYHRAQVGEALGFRPAPLEDEEPAGAKEALGRGPARADRALLVERHPYGTCRLDMDKRLDLGLPTAAPGPRRAGERTNPAASRS